MMVYKTLKLLAGIAVLLFLFSCRMEKRAEAGDQTKDFRFAFMTDIHLQPELNAPEGFQKAIECVNGHNPDFVITGGDLIMDALGQQYNRADSLYNLFLGLEKTFNMPVYHTMGNHEIFGLYKQSGVDKTHPEYGEKMFEKRVGSRYYSFDHKGWHFMVLDGIEDTGENSYVGMIDSLQMEWIRSDLNKLADSIPIIISVHIPFVTVATQLEVGSLTANGSGTVINNSKEVLTLFDGYNLKLVLQGHLHYLEDIYAGGVHYITGGAVSSRWWGGRYRGLEEGFLMIEVKGDDFSWEYVDFGWEAEEVDTW